VGHWVTDVTPLSALLPPGGRCRFTLQTPPWGKGWVRVDTSTTAACY